MLSDCKSERAGFLGLEDLRNENYGNGDRKSPTICFGLQIRKSGFLGLEDLRNENYGNGDCKSPTMCFRIANPKERGV